MSRRGKLIRGGPTALGLDEELTTHGKKELVMKCHTGPRKLTDFFNDLGNRKCV